MRVMRTGLPASTATPLSVRAGAVYLEPPWTYAISPTPLAGIGVTIDAVWPMSEATRDSLELAVLLNIQLNSTKAIKAMTPPAAAEMGALIHTLRVFSL